MNSSDDYDKLEKDGFTYEWVHDRDLLEFIGVSGVASFITTDEQLQ